MDLSGASDIVANSLTPASGPVPPAQVQSSLPSWFSPSSWAQSVGGLAGSVESWWGSSLFNPYHDVTALAGKVEDAGTSAMATASSAVAAVSSATAVAADKVTSILKWLAVIAVAVVAIYLLGFMRTLPLPGRK